MEIALAPLLAVATTCISGVAVSARVIKPRIIAESSTNITRTVISISFTYNNIF